MKLLWLLTLMMFLPLHASANLPQKCKSLRSVDDALTINTKGKQQLILIYNKSKSQLWLTHTPKDPGASAGWTSSLDSGKWSALSMNDNDFSFKCVESRPGHEQTMPCSEMLTACNKVDAIFSPKTKGNYWVAENKNINQLIYSINGRGIETSSD
jgi:hypothetical protein